MKKTHWSTRRLAACPNTNVPTAACHSQSSLLSNIFTCFLPVAQVWLPFSLLLLLLPQVPNFPFPTPPEQAALQAAEACLVALGALTSGGALTSVGRAMAAFPIGPRHARMMLEVAAWQLHMGGASDAATSAPPSAALAAEALPLAVALAAVLTVDAPFVHIDSIGGPKQDVKKVEEEGEGDEEGAGGKKKKADAAEALAAKAEREESGRKQQRARAAHAALRVNDSDALSALRALCAFMAAGEDDSFCKDNYLHARNLREAADLTRQLARCLAAAPTSRAAALPSASTTSSGKPAVNLAAELAAVAGAAKGQALHKALAARQGGRLPTALCDLLRRALAVGWADQVARRVRSAEHVKRQLATPTGKRHAVRYASCALANASSMGVDAAAAAAAAAKAEAAGVEEEVSGDVFLHPRSALHSTSPDYVVYGSLIRTEKRPYMAGVTAVEVSDRLGGCVGGCELLAWLVSCLYACLQQFSDVCASSLYPEVCCNQ